MQRSQWPATRGFSASETPSQRDGTCANIDLHLPPPKGREAPNQTCDSDYAASDEEYVGDTGTLSRVPVRSDGTAMIRRPFRFVLSTASKAREYRRSPKGGSPRTQDDPWRRARSALRLGLPMHFRTIFLRTRPFRRRFPRGRFTSPILLVIG